MPKELTHWILAERSLAALHRESALQRIIAAHRHAYLAGAILPDTLLHMFRGPHAAVALDLSRIFHSPPHCSHLTLLQAHALHPEGYPAPLLSCVLGVISHMQADIALHPYVFARTGNNIGQHYRLETAMDMEFLRQGAKPPAKLVREIFTPAVREVLVAAMGMLFDPEGKLPRRAHEQALELHARFQGMYHGFHWKVAAGIIGRVCGAPYRDQRHLFYPLFGHGRRDAAPAQWRHPSTGEWKTETVAQLADKAVAATAALFGRIEKEGFVPALSDPPGANLLTGGMPTRSTPRFQP